MRSRLKTNIQKQNTKTLIFIVAILIVVVVFGMKFLVGYSVVLEKMRNNKDIDEQKQTVDYIAPPILNPQPSATKSEKIDISGYTQSDNLIIKLYINNSLVKKTKTKTDSTFVFENVVLFTGENNIQVKASDSSGKESDFSQAAKISLFNKAPLLEVNFPHDGQVFKKDESPIKINGKTDKGVKVTINDFWAISQDDGSFYYQYNLKDGDNTLKIVATDEAGNKTEKEIKFRVE